MAKPLKNPGGRPKKTVKETLPPNWKELVLEEMGKGASKTEVRAMMLFEMKKNDPDASLSNGLFWRWLDEDEEFLEAIKEGEELSKAWWLSTGREVRYMQGAGNIKVDATLWYMNMKNRFGWTDKVDHTSKGEKLPTPLLTGVIDVQSNDGSSEDSKA